MESVKAPITAISNGLRTFYMDFVLPDRKELQRSDIQYEIIVVDSTETSIERPQKSNENFTSGEKKKHTLKTLLIVEKQSKNGYGSK